MSTTEIWKVANSCFNQVQTDLTLNETVAYTLAISAGRNAVCVDSSASGRCSPAVKKS